MKHNSNTLGALIALALLSVQLRGSAAWQWIDFDADLRCEQYPKLLPTTQAIMGIDGVDLYKRFKDLYEHHRHSLTLTNASLSEAPRIPNIIHQIWLGSPVPDELRVIMQTWQKMHPGWTYKVWTDEDIKEFPLYNRALYDATDNYGQKSDIARYEILYHLGGVYADVDSECLRSLEILHTNFDFYVGIQPPDTYFLQLGIGVIGAAPKHPVIRNAILWMKESAKHAQGTPAKTGPIHFTRVFYAHAGKPGFNDIALPPTYFYPLDAFSRVIDAKSWIEQGAFCVHYWAKTWMPAGYRSDYFKKIANESATKDWNV